MRLASARFDWITLLNRPRNLVCQEAAHRHKTVQHALFEMVEPTHQSRLAGEGFKPPKGALVKSHGIERLG